MIRIPVKLLLQPFLVAAVLLAGAHEVPRSPADGHLVVAAARAGGGFVEYLRDNPAIEGPDESPKISYAARGVVLVRPAPQVRLAQRPFEPGD